MTPIALIALLALFITPAPPQPAKALTVTSVPPIVTSTFNMGVETYVIGADGTARTCPRLPNVAPYVRAEAKGQMAFLYVPPGQMIRSTSQMSYTLACLKVE